MQGVADRARALMVAQGLNQGQVAYKSGIPAGVLSGLLKGTKDQAAFATVFKLAQGLGVSLDELAGVTPLRNLEPLPESGSGELRSRVASLEKDLLALAKGQREILRRLQDEQSPTRRRTKSA